METCVLYYKLQLTLFWMEEGIPAPHGHTFRRKISIFPKLPISLRIMNSSILPLNRLLNMTETMTICQNIQ